jgi:hypothetical protein
MDFGSQHRKSLGMNSIRQITMRSVVKPGLAIGQFVPVLDLELTRDYRTPGNQPVYAESHRSTPEVHTELIPELEASGPS